MSIAQKIKGSPKLKKLLLGLLMPSNQARPRLWVSLFVNPFFHKKGKGASICRRTRLDVLPFNPFILGANSTIEDFSTLNNGMGGIYIGGRCRVGLSNVLIGPIQIGNDVILAQHVVLSAMNHGYQDITIPIKAQPCSSAAIIVEDEAWIGANVVVTAGVRIGKHAVVAAGSVVTKNVAPYTVVGGNPAKILKNYNFISNQWEREHTVGFTQSSFKAY